MAFTVTIKEDRPLIDKCAHNYKLVTGTLLFSASYPTGGEAMDLSKIFPSDTHMVFIEPKAGYLFIYDYTNKKVLAYWTPAGHTAVFAEITATTNLSSSCADVRFFAIGK
jgi:hypothetical protein